MIGFIKNLFIKKEFRKDTNTNINNKKDDSLKDKERTKAETLLNQFGVIKTSMMSDEEIIMEFSRFGDTDNAVSPMGYNFPEANLMKRNTTSYEVGAIMLQKFVPGYRNIIISSEEWVEMFKKSQDRFVKEEEDKKNYNYNNLVFQIIKSGKCYDNINGRRYLNISKLLETIGEVYYINKQKVKNPPNLMKLIQYVASHYGYPTLKSLFHDIEMEDNEIMLEEKE